MEECTTELKVYVGVAMVSLLVVWERYWAIRSALILDCFVPTKPLQYRFTLIYHYWLHYWVQYTPTIPLLVCAMTCKITPIYS